jgi:hypothetical protein
MLSTLSCRRVSSVEAEVPAWLRDALAASARQPKPQLSLAGVCDTPQPVDEVESLAAPGRAIVRCCDNDSGGFTIGCMINRACVYLISNAKGWTTASNRDELARALAPITSPAQALGLVALSDQNHSLTGARPSVEVLDAQARGRSLKVAGAVVRSEAKGYVVRVVDGPFCTCPRSITLQTYAVTQAGSVTHRASERLADDDSQTCPE